MENRTIINRNDNSNAILMFGLAAIFLGQALQHGNGSFTITALKWLSVSLVCATAGILLAKVRIPAVPMAVTWAVLALGLAFQVYQLYVYKPIYHIDTDFTQYRWIFNAAVVGGGGLALISLLPFPQKISWLRKVLFAGVILSVAVAGVWVIHASPAPHIDVFLFEQSSGKALLQGKNPYQVSLPNIYVNSLFYGRSLIRNGRLTIGNPYPPLSIYLSTLGYILGHDIRYSHLAALLIGAILMATLRPGKMTLLATYLFLFTPRIYLVLEQSWTEPLVLMMAAIVVWLALKRPRWELIALGLLMVIKQYMLFLFPLVFLLNPRIFARKKWLQNTAAIGGAGLLVTAPLMLWNFPTFVWNVGIAQWDQVFRRDALSYAAYYFRLTGHQPTQLLPFFVLGAAMILLLWKLGVRSPAGFAAASAWCLALFFAVSKQAFCNYYFLVIGLFCIAIAAGIGKAPENVEELPRQESALSLK